VSDQAPCPPDKPVSNIGKSEQPLTSGALYEKAMEMLSAQLAELKKCGIRFTQTKHIAISHSPDYAFIGRAWLSWEDNDKTISSLLMVWKTTAGEQESIAEFWEIMPKEGSR